MAKELTIEQEERLKALAEMPEWSSAETAEMLQLAFDMHPVQAAEIAAIEAGEHSGDVIRL